MAEREKCRCARRLVLVMDRLADAYYAPPHLPLEISLKQARSFLEEAERECRVSFYETKTNLEDALRHLRVGDTKSAMIKATVARLDLLRGLERCRAKMDGHRKN